MARVASARVCGEGAADADAGAAAAEQPGVLLQPRRARSELVGQPSFLCRAHLCYAFEVGTCDGIVGSNHPSDRVECDCMQHAWAGDDEMPRWPAHKPMLLLEREQYMGWEPSLSFSWLDPPPGGRYGPSFVPAAAAHKLTRADLRMMEPDPVDGWRESDLRKYPSYGKV